MNLEDAVTLGAALVVLEYKQMELRPMQDQCKKNFSN
jgi:hypothetical protein